MHQVGPACQCRPVMTNGWGRVSRLNARCSPVDTVEGFAVALLQRADQRVFPLLSTTTDGTMSGYDTSDFGDFPSLGPSPINVGPDRFVVHADACHIAWVGDGIEHDVRVDLHVVTGGYLTLVLPSCVAVGLARALERAAGEVRDAVAFVRRHQDLAVELRERFPLEVREALEREDNSDDD